MACVTKHNVVPFIGRKKTPTQNVMCVTDFDLCFTFVCSGWEGSAHDSRIFTSTINDPVMRFLTPAEGTMKSIFCCLSKFNSNVFFIEWNTQIQRITLQDFIIWWILDMLALRGSCPRTATNDTTYKCFVAVEPNIGGRKSCLTIDTLHYDRWWNELLGSGRIDLRF